MLANLLLKSQDDHYDKERLALARFRSQEERLQCTPWEDVRRKKHKEKTVLQTAELNGKLKEVDDFIGRRRQSYQQTL